MNSKISICIFVCYLVVFNACKTKTETYTTNFTLRYANGKTIDVSRTDSFNHYIGIYSGKEYSESHYYNYDFEITPDACKWKGANRQVPQKILFCDDAIYIQVFGEKVLIDSTNFNATPSVVDAKLYFKNIDNRYLFNLLGDQFFEAIDSVLYKEKRKLVKEERIPFQ